MTSACGILMGRAGHRAILFTLLGTLAGPASAQAPAPSPATPNPQLAAAQVTFEALPEAERKAIQTDLIWTGHFSGAVSGSYGPLTFRAINALKAGRGQPDGLLSPADRQGLAQQANAARQAAGFRLVGDDRTGVRIGIPERVLSKRETIASGGSRWQSADGKVTLDTTSSAPTEPLEAIFEKATAVNPNNPGRKITYKLLRPDFFVVTGETPTGRFYRRLALGPQGLRGFSIGYDKALAPELDKLVIAIAGSFDPFPTGPLPASPSGAIAGVTGAPAAGTGAAPPLVPPLVPPRPPTERYGVALALSDRLAVTATAAVEGCRSLRVGNRPARLRSREDGAGLALLDLDGGGVAVAAPRAEAPGEREVLVLVAYGDDAGKRAAVALPGQAARIGANPAVFAPLQPGQAGSPAFDRQGRLVGLVTANPSDKLLVAGIAPQRSYGLADAAVLQAVLAKAGASLAPAAGSGELSTGAIVDKVGRSVLPLSCGLTQ
jgi:hypothetical protein